MCFYGTHAAKLQIVFVQQPNKQIHDWNNLYAITESVVNKRRVFQMLNPKFFRILIVEDNVGRIHRLKLWLPDDVRLVWVSSAGKALGMLRLDKGNVYAGIMLDHDLTERTLTEADRRLSGRDVVDEIIRNIPNRVPVLVHSENHDFSPAMVKKLEAHKFRVTRVPMSSLTRESFSEWVDDVRDVWEDYLEVD